MTKTMHFLAVLFGFTACNAGAASVQPTVNLTSSIEDSAYLGMVKAGSLCLPSGGMFWGRKPHKIDLVEILRDNPDSYKTLSLMAPDGFALTAIQGEILKVESRLCFKNGGFRDFSTLKGDLSVTVKWTLTDTDGKILTVEKENHHHIEKFRDSDLNTEFSVAIFGQN